MIKERQQKLTADAAKVVAAKTAEKIANKLLSATSIASQPWDKTMESRMSDMEDSLSRFHFDQETSQKIRKLCQRTLEDVDVTYDSEEGTNFADTSENSNLQQKQADLKNDIVTIISPEIEIIAAIPRNGGASAGAGARAGAGADSLEANMSPLSPVEEVSSGSDSDSAIDSAIDDKSATANEVHAATASPTVAAPAPETTPPTTVGELLTIVSGPMAANNNLFQVTLKFTEGELGPYLEELFGNKNSQFTIELNNLKENFYNVPNEADTTTPHVPDLLTGDFSKTKPMTNEDSPFAGNESSVNLTFNDATHDNMLDEQLQLSQGTANNVGTKVKQSAHIHLLSLKIRKAISDLQKEEVIKLDTELANNTLQIIGQKMVLSQTIDKGLEDNFNTIYTSVHVDYNEAVAGAESGLVAAKQQIEASATANIKAAENASAEEIQKATAAITEDKNTQIEKLQMQITALQETAASNISAMKTERQGALDTEIAHINKTKDANITEATQEFDATKAQAKEQLEEITRDACHTFLEAKKDLLPIRRYRSTAMLAAKGPVQNDGVQTSSKTPPTTPPRTHRQQDTSLATPPPLTTYNREGSGAGAGANQEKPRHMTMNGAAANKTNSRRPSTSRSGRFFAWASRRGSSNGNSVPETNAATTNPEPGAASTNPQTGSTNPSHIRAL